jgi:hypothetical protein
MHRAIFCSDNTEQAMLEMRAETHARFRFKFPLLSIFSNNLHVSTEVLSNSHISDLRKTRSAVLELYYGDSWTDRQDMHGDDNGNIFATFHYERAQNMYQNVNVLRIYGFNIALQ